MRLALEAANEMEQLSIIGKYAIAGSVAIIYYAEPIDTEDLDIFFLHETKASEIFSMQEIYKYFSEKGFTVSDFTVYIGGVKVQFVPSTSSLSDESIQNAREVAIFGVKTRVVSPEYLVALKLRAGRGKDYTHILHLLGTTSIPIDFGAIDAILLRHNLREKWDRFLELTQWTKPN